MKKTIFLSMFLVLLVGCSNVYQVDKKSRKVNYVCPYDTTLSVEYSADGKTAKLFDQQDKIYILNQKISGSGTYYQSDTDVWIREKSGNLLVEFVKGQTIECKEYKN